MVIVTASPSEDGSTIPAAEAESDRSHPTNAQLIVAMHCDRPLAAKVRHSLSGIGAVHIGRGDAPPVRTRVRGEVVLTLEIPDPMMSRAHARIVQALGRWTVQDLSSKNGTYLDRTRVSQATLRDGHLVHAGRTLLLFRDGVPVAFPEIADLDEAQPFAPGLVTFSARLASVHDTVMRLAPTDVPLLVTGATGTGKEVIASALHGASRRPGQLVSVNCSGIASNLIEATLYGHRRGAFTGATEDRLGVVRSADRGTLFLDEIGDLPLAAQGALLRVLQAHEVTPVGESRPIKVDFRLVSATHRHLPTMVQQGTFRADLFARLSGVTVNLPTLAERREDLGLLIAALLRRRTPNGSPPPALRQEAARELFRRTWPLNVRELEQCLAAATALAGDGPIELAHLPPAPLSQVRAEGSSPVRLDDARREELVASLQRHGGNVAAVARELGKGRMQIHRWVTRYRIDLRAYRER